MRVVWVAPNGGQYNVNGLSGTGGWIASLEKVLTAEYSDLELGIIFPHETDQVPITNGKVTYMPIPTGKFNNIQKLFRRIVGLERKYEAIIVEQIEKAINSYNPDIVHVWGCENFYSTIVLKISKPYVIHIQGLASSYINVYTPPLFGKKDLSKADGFINYRLFKRGFFQRYQEFALKARREKEIITHCSNWIGRTDWDKRTIKVMNPLANYYHCDEIIREEFFVGQWFYHYNGHLVIQSTISESWYKGIDIVLQTAKILTERKIDFEWNVCGVRASSSLVKYMSKCLNIVAEKVHVNFLGSCSANMLKERLLLCDVYVHPSHIENSSNAICEAMCLGVPVIAEYVGGTPTILNNDAGKLVHAYNPYMMAAAILDMICEKNSKHYSSTAREIAFKRHNPKKIVNELNSIYNNILNQYE